MPMHKTHTNYTNPTELLTSSQTITTGWVTVGSEIDAKAYNYATVFIKITNTSGVDNRFRVVLETASGESNEYKLPINDSNVADIKVNDDVRELADDATVNQVMGFDIPPGCFLKVQVQAGTGGDSLTSCKHVLSTL